jgi:hypothetical protein
MGDGVLVIANARLRKRRHILREAHVQNSYILWKPEAGDRLR